MKRPAKKSPSDMDAPLQKVTVVTTKKKEISYKVGVCTFKVGVRFGDLRVLL